VVQAKPPQAAKRQNDDDDDYGDDFEDGFEVEQMLEAQKATHAENAAVRKQQATVVPQQTQRPSSSALASPESQVVGQSRFGADDLQRQLYRAQFEKDLARATALRRLVDLDEVSVTIADIPPMSGYDLYIRNVGGSAGQQRGVQAPPLEDMRHVEVQAERVYSRSKQSQCPDDLGIFPEKDLIRPASSADGEQSQNADAPESKATSMFSIDVEALSAFMRRVYPVMRTLLDESEYGRTAAKSRVESRQAFSSFYTNLYIPEFAARAVTRVAFSPLAPQYLLALHGAPHPAMAPAAPTAKSTTKSPLDRFASFVAIWNTNDPLAPDKLLVSHCGLTAACFSPSRPHLVYGAAAEGCVAVWDLREPDSQHSLDAKETHVPRIASFSTEWQSENHSSPIVNMCVAGYNSVVGVRREESEQLVTLDTNGNIFLWIVNDQAIAKGSGPDSDLGQNILSSLRIVRASMIPCGLDYALAFDFDFSPIDPSHYIVAGPSSLVHLSRFGSVAAPSQYTPQSYFLGTAVSSPSSVHCSCIDSRIIVGGYFDGCVRLYLREDPNSQLTVPLGTAPIVVLRASRTVKLITFALDLAGVFYILDHAAEQKDAPVMKTSFGGEAGICTTFDASIEDKAESRLGFGFSDGSVQVHTMKNTWLPPQRNEKWL
jgi:hypothetical protein